MNVNHLIAPYKPPVWSNLTIPISTSQVPSFKQKLLNMLKSSTHLSKKKKKIQTYHNKWVVNLQNKRGHLNDVEDK